MTITTTKEGLHILCTTVQDKWGRKSQVSKAYGSIDEKVTVTEAIRRFRRYISTLS